jgi:hypothetical protein
MPRVVYHRLAGNELIQSGLFYERRRRFLGEEFIDAVEQILAEIQKQPLIGRLEECGARSLKVRRFPFRVAYQIQSDRLWVVALGPSERAVGLVIGGGEWHNSLTAVRP